MKTNLDVYGEPYMSMVRFLYENGNTSIENMISYMNGEIGKGHIEDAEESSLIKQNNGGYEITVRGRIVLRNVLSMRKNISGIPEGDEMILQKLNEPAR